MKVTINGTVTKEALKAILQNQKEKIKVVDEFCKENKFYNFSYKDSEIEYEFEKPKKVEVRKNEE